ncbi:MAG: Ig-like domain-containing protein, partial [Chitinophagaceae bacterium]
MKKLLAPAGTRLRAGKSYLATFQKTVMIFSLLVFIAGCKKVIEEEGTKGICPKVVSTTPVDGATSVSINTAVNVSFNEALNPASLNAETFTLTAGNVAVAGAYSFTGKTATLSPTSALTPNTTYTGTITTGVKDPAGNAIQANYVWRFTTGAAPDVQSPTVIATDPQDLATGVALSKKISATFSEVMDSLSTTLNFTLSNTSMGGTPVPGTVSYSGSTVLFTPSSMLTANTTYRATITSGARDVAGNRMLSDYTWSFTTLSAIVVVPPPALGSASLFGVIGGNAGMTNQGLNTVINNGSIGTTAASTLITGFHDGTTGDIYTETPLNAGLVKGRIYAAPPAPGSDPSFVIATNGLADANTAYNSISPASKPGGIDPGAGELGGLTLAPGIYKSASGTFKITNGDLTLNAMGDPNAVWIFQTAAGLTVGLAGPAGARSVKMINGAAAKNVFWYVGSAATINAAGGGTMVGTIIASAGITFSTAGNAVQTVLNGRALSLNASVTMVNTTI